ncbi:kinetochore protein NUF2 homolog [Panicum virgatum]|uniref:Kinetochore protein Nuf2 N-terminal domain-containing protein n=2 Tax=Panicum virgatum TaxID=38727 RepID=A0A8T0MF02_PANVG|nr:kinetochore protein NUF2 homolog [Panicum virgatum]KAG2533858.1 hypothetical protein PVAP13_9NG012751 [Panicum virgatum]KAG2533859.1 hypothetical protein PVAP13_9NG012751 [Panicum virgatum]
MASTFSFPEMTPAQLAEALHTFGIAPTANLRAEDIATPQLDLLPGVLSLFLATIVGDDPDDQLGFDLLQKLDNPEHHMGAIGLRSIYGRARDVLESIHFGGLTFRDLTRPEPRRVVYILSAIVNYLHFRHEKLALLNPIAEEFSSVDDRLPEGKARIAELQKVKENHASKEQMDEPAVQQLQAEVNALKQKIQEYNTKQLALRGRAKSIDEKKEGILAKISQADFELMKRSQENSKLLSKIVQSPEKFQKNLEEKKGVRDELKTLEKMAMHKVQDKTNALEMYTKVCEKLSKHLSKIDALHETSTSAKASEKEVKALKAKISDQSLEMKTLHIKADEWRSKVHETEDRLKAKEKEKDQRIGENKQKMAALKSEVESELKCLADRERETEEKVAKAADLCSKADAVEAAGRKKREEIFAQFEQVCETANLYMDGIDHSVREVDEANMTIIGQCVASCGN